MNYKPTIDTWTTNPADIGPLYPFVGSEFVLCLLCLAFFGLFMFWKFRSERQTYDRQVAAIRERAAKQEKSDPHNNDSA